MWSQCSLPPVLIEIDRLWTSPKAGAAPMLGYDANLPRGRGLVVQRSILPSTIGPCAQFCFDCLGAGT